MKYIFIDIDGTLYSNKINSVPNSAYEAIKKTREKGNKVFLCTGRALAEAKLYLNLDIDGFVFSSGTCIYAENKRIFDKPFDKESVNDLVNIFEENEVGYALAGYAGSYTDAIGRKYVSYYFGANIKDEIELNSVLQDNGLYGMDYRHQDDLITKICLYSDSLAKLDKVNKLLPKEYVFDVTHKGENEYFGDVIQSNLNKFTGVKVILDYYGGKVEDTIAIGDSNNDYQMIKHCNIGVAMGNAFDTIKEISDYVTTDILDDGIYNAFKKYDLL